MRIFTLFKRRTAVAEMMLFAFALGMGSLGCLPKPLLSFASSVLLLLAIAAMAYGMWLLARPDSQTAKIKYGMTLLGIAVMAGLLAAFSFNVSGYETMQLQNALTDSSKHDYIMSQLVLFAIQAAAGVGVTYGFYSLFKLRRHEVTRLLFLAIAAMPLLFVLMQLYALIFPPNMALLLLLWLGSTALVAFGTYKLTEGDYVYVAIFAALTILTLPIGLTTFALFFFLRGFMPPIKNIPLYTENDIASESGPMSLDENPYYARQLKSAGEKLRQASAALDAVEARIKKVDSESVQSAETLKVLEAEKVKRTTEKIAAEEAYERRLKLHQ